MNYPKWTDEQGIQWGMDDTKLSMLKRFTSAYHYWLRKPYKPYVGPKTREEMVERIKFLKTLRNARLDQDARPV